MLCSRQFFRAFLAAFTSREKKAEGQYNRINIQHCTYSNNTFFNNQTNTIHKVEPGFHSLSNAFLDTPWPKTETARSGFEEIINPDRPIDEDAIFDLLRNQTRYPDELLPSTGLSQEMERAVSSIFITSDGYGSRCSTLIFSDSNGNTTFIEKTYKPGITQVENTVRYRF
jgi:uncharacterized protein with NRDE domain